MLKCRYHDRNTERITTSPWTINTPWLTQENGGYLPERTKSYQPKRSLHHLWAVEVMPEVQSKLGDQLVEVEFCECSESHQIQLGFLRCTRCNPNDCMNRLCKTTPLFIVMVELCSITCIENHIVHVFFSSYGSILLCTLENIKHYHFHRDILFLPICVLYIWMFSFQSTFFLIIS